MRSSDYLTAQEVAEQLHMHVKRVQLLARQGKLPTVRHGRRWLFPREQIVSRATTAAATRGIDLSARNQLRGTIRRLQRDGLMVEVTIRLAAQDLVAVITKASAQRLGLTEGGDALAVIKATEVMVARNVR